MASRVYKKGPQTLVDAISEVEKLQAAQQLTMALLLSSTVNVMSSEDDRNVSSVKNWDTWHVIAHIYDVLIVMSMVT